MLQHGTIAHCFDYVRQGIMCAGDLIIESATEFSEKWLESVSEGIVREKYRGQRPVLVDRWGSKHQCWRFDEAWDWTFGDRVPAGSGAVL